MPRSNNLYSYHFQHNLKVAAIVLTYIVLAAGALVLLGWQLDIALLRRPFQDYVSMHPLTALCFILSAIALLCLVKRRSRALTNILSGLVLLAGLLQVLSHLGMEAANVGRHFYPGKTATDLLHEQPNIMAPFTAVNFLVDGASIMLLATQQRARLAQHLILFVLWISVFSITGYFYGVSAFYNLFAYYPMAVHTAACFLLLSVAILFARSNKGFMREFISPYGGSRLAKLLLPLGVLVPVLLGLLYLYGEKSGLYSRPFGLAVFSILTVTIFILIVWKAMAEINKLSFELGEGKARHVRNELGGMIMNAALEAIVCIDKQGKITFWNPRAEKIFGWRKEEVLGEALVNLIIPEEYRGRHVEGMKRHLETGETRMINNVILTTAINRQGNILQVELAITKLQGGDQEIFCGFIRDITETLQHTRDIEAQNKRLKEIAWIQSHVLRTPVANILGIMELLSDPTLDKTTADQLQHNMRQSVVQLDEIICEIVRKAEQV